MSNSTRVLKARCRKCDHLFLWDEGRYSRTNHIVLCRGCGSFLGGGFKCQVCSVVVQLLNRIPPEFCLLCGSAYGPYTTDRV
jgi:hypothetical protein